MDFEVERPEGLARHVSHRRHTPPAEAAYSTGKIGRIPRTFLLHRQRFKSHQSRLYNFTIRKNRSFKFLAGSESRRPHYTSPRADISTIQDRMSHRRRVQPCLLFAFSASGPFLL